jgi:acetoin utilization deacetylase AcuC-like enzyme
VKTLIIHHDDCLRHDPGPRHPERPDRVAAVLNAIGNLEGTEKLPAPRATPEQLLLAHPADYVRLLAEREPAAGTAGERVALDPDTWLSPGSLDAALRGSGAACFAIDQLFAGRARNAFCVTRPPGHHAEAARAMGFCLFNHVAVAARYAGVVHGAARVAILDFDVHHGNGTQAIFETSPDVLYVSTHQAPLYPGTGNANEIGCGNVLNLPLPPGADSRKFRDAWYRQGLPALERFAPELVLVSAGFDGHLRDPLAQLELQEADYAWITREIRKLAEAACEGRLVSLLEGGYDLEALGASAAAHVTALVS